jgi:hypothetical protein
MLGHSWGSQGDETSPELVKQDVRVAEPPDRKACVRSLIFARWPDHGVESIHHGRSPKRIGMRKRELQLRKPLSAHYQPRSFSPGSVSPRHLDCDGSL